MSDPKLISLHIAGAFALFIALGAVFSGNSPKKGTAILHGIGLLVILGVGFAMLKKPPMDQYWWMAKLGIWVFLAAVPAMAKRKVMARSILLTLSIIAGGGAAWLGLARPF